MNEFLKVRDLHATVVDKKILNGVDLTIGVGETHVIMGPNGSGKSTLANVIMGNPKYKVESGSILFQGKEIIDMKPEDRAVLGLFLAFQYPREIAGVQWDRFLFMAYQTLARGRLGQDAHTMSVFEFNEKLFFEMERLGIKKEFASRSLNQGFSGGEKKKAEMLQLAMLDPYFAIFDETDSGLDVDALRIVGSAVNDFRQRPGKSVLMVTHYRRLLEYVKPDFVHVMIDGRIVRSGNADLARELEEGGYEKLSNS